MSTTTVRAAITSFLNANALGGATPIPGINKVYTAPPYWADGNDWNLASQLGSGAVVAVHLPEESESRNTLPALTGQKRVDYLVGIMIFYQWLLPSGDFNSHPPDAWVYPLDTITDGLKAALRAAPNLGSPSVIFQAAQGRIHGGAPDLVIKRGLPRRSSKGGKVLSWSALEFTAIEIVTG